MLAWLGTDRGLMLFEDRPVQTPGGLMPLKEPPRCVNKRPVERLEIRILRPDAAVYWHIRQEALEREPESTQP